ncbi:interferon-inducible GTPase 1-like [Otolemur garnettii]|uniref:Interferon-gamma-inducible GTPase IFGGA1 protein n=1 Tax=Otolemur garnettii TaxID=30611 RepID=J7PCG7_OTOGA|nr:interferon-inducible GTPase 1-like [Otolemur garnettii]CBY65978.1 TPA: interferon-gamma-inducible GTPase IFGGA1 protein [Otolemur garnettii]
MGQHSSAASHDDQDLASSCNAYFKNFKMENKIISQETIDLMELHLKKGDIQGANSVINDALKEIDNVPLSIAVIGECGVGKSSLINALRGVGNGDQDLAPTGVVGTTRERSPYKHPKFPNVTFWDLPAIGTSNYQQKDYLEKVKFGEYDFFIIVSAVCFKKNDIDLAQMIQIMKKNFYFVRTKVDLDLEAEQVFKKTAFDREKVLQQIRNDYLNIFKQNKINEPPIFLISNRDLSEYDFPILIDTLIKDLPIQKHHIFMLSLPNVTEAAIESKRDSLKQMIWLDALKAGALAPLRMVGITSNRDVEKLKTSLNQYRVLFGVDDASLERLAKDLQVPVKQLKATLKSPSLLQNKKEESIGEMLLKYLERVCSADGFLASGISFGKTYYLQLHFLNTVTEDAKVLLKETFKKRVESGTCGSKE